MIVRTCKNCRYVKVAVGVEPCLACLDEDDEHWPRANWTPPREPRPVGDRLTVRPVVCIGQVWVARANPKRRIVIKDVYSGFSTDEDGVRRVSEFVSYLLEGETEGRGMEIKKTSLKAAYKRETPR